MHIIFESLLMQLSELVCARRKIQLAKAGAFSFLRHSINKKYAANHFVKMFPHTEKGFSGLNT